MTVASPLYLREGESSSGRGVVRSGSDVTTVASRSIVARTERLIDALRSARGKHGAEVM